MSKLVSAGNPIYKLLLNRYYEPKMGANIIGVKLTHDVVAQSGEFIDRKIIDWADYRQYHQQYTA